MTATFWKNDAPETMFRSVDTVERCPMCDGRLKGLRLVGIGPGQGLKEELRFSPGFCTDKNCALHWVIRHPHIYGQEVSDQVRHHLAHLRASHRREAHLSKTWRGRVRLGFERVGRLFRKSVEDDLTRLGMSLTRAGDGLKKLFGLKNP